MPNTEARLQRIEDKVDKMAEAMIALARFEEKMDAYNEYRTNSWERMNKFSAKLDTIEKMCDDNARTVHTINKLAWVVASAMAAIVVKVVMMG
tara:strand:- start:6604 stop:6882 length:279 start_codon:yes stop_codon:yes gene_type:complete